MFSFIVYVRCLQVCSNTFRYIIRIHYKGHHPTHQHMDLTQLTAEYMSNRKFAEKWDGDGSRRMTRHQAFLNDLEFYKERSIELTIALLQDRDNVEPHLTKDVLTAFHTYMRACICFFRSKDMNDLHQQEHLGEVEEDGAEEGKEKKKGRGEGDFSSFARKTEQELEAEAWQELEALCDDGTGEEGEVPYQFADTIMMRHITLKTQPNNLDRFLKLEKTETPPSIILPQQKEIDLEHPDLKKKPFFPPPPLQQSLPHPPSQPLPIPPPATPATTSQVPDPVAEKSINDVRETVTQMMDEILCSVLEKFETETEPQPEVPTFATTPIPTPTDKKNKGKGKKKKQTSTEALHVDI